MSRIAKQLKHHRAGGGNHRRRNVIAASLAAIVLVAAGLAAALLPSRGGAGRNTLRVAARTDVISYLDANGITAYIENKAEIDIQWLDYGTINVAGRVAQDASAAPKELPDAYLGLGLTGEELSALNESAFLNIMNMYQTESNELKTFLAQDTSRLSEMYSGGGIYSYPTLDEESFAAQYPQKLWINAEWLNKLGLAMPATTDELYVVLKAFREGDPNGNGAADEIPLGIAYNGTGNSGFGFLINAFITTDFDMSETGNYLNVSDGGEVYCAAAEPAFERALTYIQRLFREGLVSADAFELGRETFLDGGATEIYGVVAAPDIYNAFNSMGRADSFEPLPPLYGENRATAPRRAPITLGGYMIAKNTQKYALAFKLGDAMLSAEGTLSLIY
ncbi:MAG: extracellular solute-binding protein, partial [Oscillospiraceae bacterium]|nr:extracellular solute-binding protein [Oscillospiraceae bacterium]